jgi:hypothetical protein
MNVRFTGPIASGEPGFCTVYVQDNDVHTVNTHAFFSLPKLHSMALRSGAIILQVACTAPGQSFPRQEVVTSCMQFVPSVVAAASMAAGFVRNMRLLRRRNPQTVERHDKPTFFALSAWLRPAQSNVLARHPLGGLAFLDAGNAAVSSQPLRYAS